MRTVAAVAALAGAAALSANPGAPGPERLPARVHGAAALSAGALDWEYAATQSDRVPASALHEAAAIRIAVIDTGADVTAPDLASKRPTAYNVRARTADITDTNGHGTFVASLVAGEGGDADLLIVKATNTAGDFTIADEAGAIRYAVDHGARIINLSFAGTTTGSAEQRAIAYAVGHGALLVAAAGNAHAHGDPLEYPAALLQPPGSNGQGGAGLVVAASTRDGSRASFSSTGSWISLAAPGMGVLGAVSRRSSPAAFPRTSVPGSSGLFGYASGTSVAAPQVAGAAALVWGANSQLSAQQVAQILKETASGHGTWTPELGYGVIDVAAAVARASAAG